MYWTRYKSLISNQNQTTLLTRPHNINATRHILYWPFRDEISVNALQKSDYVSMGGLFLQFIEMSQFRSHLNSILSTLLGLQASCIFQNEFECLPKPGQTLIIKVVQIFNGHLKCHIAFMSMNIIVKILMIGTVADTTYLYLTLRRFAYRYFQNYITLSVVKFRNNVVWWMLCLLILLVRTSISYRQ